ncbi:hypothetical protein RhiirC2_800984 [Rhizophagus irregularis]|uniref:Uncharacterized protein n=1 Tax=Rhizophagus irregularis TaxID=588596 RepID=A0A2N1M2Y8_9GLOM|nr:hypothetical protein RhiirC2_800984 [Rhizophagus irregularis]
MEGEAVENWVTATINDETVENWTEENLKEFEEVGMRLTTEVLCWHDDAAKSIRAVYTGNSRTTAWRKKNEKKRLSDDAKRMKTLDNFFKNTEIRTYEDSSNCYWMDKKKWMGTSCLPSRKTFKTTKFDK